jgi:hypothetical protein
MAALARSTPRATLKPTPHTTLLATPARSRDLTRRPALPAPSTLANMANAGVQVWIA